MIAKKLLTTIAFAFVLLFSGCADDDFEEIDGVCPLVISTVPDSDAVGVPLNQVITATFNEVMKPSTITSASFLVSANGAQIAGTVTYAGSTATFTPNAPLLPDTEYTGTITTLASDPRGNFLQENYVWTFNTAATLNFTVAISANPSEGGTVTGAGLFDEGALVAVTATENEGYTFIDWTVDGVTVSTDANYEFVLTQDITLEANFEADTFTVAVSANPSEGGTVTGAGLFDEGTLVAVAATENVGYTFIDWTVNGVTVSTDANYEFVLTQDITLVANFEADAFKLTVNAINGTVNVVPDQLTYDSGDSVELEAIPNSGYEFLSWSGDESGTDNPLTVIMDEDKVITANFVLIAVAECDSPAVDLGLAKNYAILAESGISTTGTTHVTGDMGISPAAATLITGFDLILTAGAAYSTSSLVTGKIYAPGYADPTPALLTTAVDNMHTAFTTANGLAADVTELMAGNLNGETLVSGVYKWDTGLSVTNSITLDGGGVDCAPFVFQIAGDLTIANGTEIILTNGAKADNIYWVVAGSGAMLGTTVDFSGNILSKTLISVNTGSSVKGRLLAQTAVTLDASAIVKP